MADRIIDPSTFSIPALALELEGNALRFALATNVYGSSMEFLVRVLTSPIPMGRYEQDAICRFMKTGRIAAQTATEAAAAVIARERGLPTSDIPFSFQGRILGEPGRPSPHSFLPDPCVVNVAQNKLKAAQLISLHTNFRSPAGYTGPVPRMGDIVKVSMDAGTQGPFSLQKAFFKTLEKKKDAAQEAINNQDECGSSLSSLWTDTPVSNIRMPAPPTEDQKVADHFILNVPMTGKYTSPYGTRKLPSENAPRPHWGIDIGAAEGTAIRAPADGYRFRAGNQVGLKGGAGNYVRTIHTYHTDPKHTEKSTNNKAIVFSYMHMKEPTTLTSAQKITRGQEVGKCGGTGYKQPDMFYGRHLHFEAVVFDVPAGSLNKNGGVLASAATAILKAFNTAKGARQDPIQVCRWDAHFAGGPGKAQVTTSQSSKLNEDAS